MSNNEKFAEGEKVLCFHRGLIYEAKCLKTKLIKAKHVKYYIHYIGWNKRFDEWVPETRVLKYNEANLLKQKEVQDAHKAKETLKKSETKETCTRHKTRRSDSSKCEPTASFSISQDSSSADPKKKRGKFDPTFETKCNKSDSNDTDTRYKRRSENSKCETTASLTISQDSSSDVPKNKRAKFDPTIETKCNKSNSKGTDTRFNTGRSEKFKCEPTASFSVSQHPSSVVPKKAHVKFDPTKNALLREVEIKLRIPDELKPWLVDDCVAITRLRKLVNLPATITVAQIFDNYLAFKKSGENTNESEERTITEIMHGMKEYFNIMLGSQLLYKYERPQYQDLLTNHPETPLSSIYGSIHLLRLFVKLGPMIADLPIDERIVRPILQNIPDFLNYLTKNSADLFSLRNYCYTTPEYDRRVP